MYKDITVLADAGNGTLSIATCAIEPCSGAPTGWAIMTLAGPDPINGETTQLVGWGNLDGKAIVHGGYYIPVAAISTS